jgi:hypothetical protein
MALLVYRMMPPNVATPSNHFKNRCPASENNSAKALKAYGQKARKLI